MDNSRVWDKILSYIRGQISPANFRTWFSQTDLGELNESDLTILVPSAFIKEQLNSRYRDLLVQAAKEVLQKELMVEFRIDSKISQTGKVSHEEEPFELGSSYSSPPPNYTPSLNLKYTLKNFVVGLTNNLAYAAAQAVVANPGISYNPLFIYGPSGVGKTHLMQGIGNALLKKNPSIKINFSTSEKFMNDFIDSIQTKKTTTFRNKYRNCDALFIDDVQFISGKDSTQEEFFHTFNELHTKNCQIVLTSDRTPTEMIKLESRLLSRFQGGLMVDIQLPDFDTRVAILKAKLAEKGENMPDELLRIIAESVESNTRELEGKLIQILQISKLTNQPPNEELVLKIAGKLTSAKAGNQLDHRKVFSTINQYFNIKITDLTGPRRQKELVLPRQITMFILYEDCKIPMEKIGEMLGGRDHTTILYGIEKIRKASKDNKDLQKLIIDIKHQLTN